MAGEAHGKATEQGTQEAPRTSIEDHERTYGAFLNITKWAVIGVVVILIGLLMFLV